MSDQLKTAAEALLDHYTSIVASGDFGDWKVEEEEQVINLRAALAILQQESDIDNLAEEIRGDSYGESEAACQSQPTTVVEPFVVKYYISDDGPSIKGNGFDGLRIGDDRQEAEEFISFVNKALGRIVEAKPSDARDELIQLCRNITQSWDEGAVSVADEGFEILIDQLRTLTAARTPPSATNAGEQS